MQNYANIRNDNSSFENLLENMETAAKQLRKQLGYSDDNLTFTFEDLITRLDKIEHLTIKKYESPVRPMSTATENGYMIVIGGGIDSRTGKEQLLHEIAHILFDEILPKYDGDPRSYTEIRADLFARCFLMPKVQFLEAFIENSNNDEVVNINGIANVFDVNDYMVMKRGVELLGWK